MMADLWIRTDYYMYSTSSFSQIFLQDNENGTMSLCAVLKHSDDKIIIEKFKDTDSAVAAFESLVEAKFCNKPVLDLTVHEENINFR